VVIRVDALPRFKPNLTRGGQVIQTAPAAWHLEIPAGPAGRYRLAQIDDYAGLPRWKFPWREPYRLELRARASAQELPGTWGFGLWNNPFGMGVYSLPVLPNAAWFFFASRPNYLSLRDDLPAQGGLAATFRSPRWPAALLLPGVLGLPLLAFPPAVRLARRLGRKIVYQDAASLALDPTAWHTYSLEWKAGQLSSKDPSPFSPSVILLVDDETVLHTPVTPRGPLGLVIWIDNQYAAVPPDGRLRFGALENPEPAWIEVEMIQG
jgi:hypothetical protein